MNNTNENGLDPWAKVLDADSTIDEVEAAVEKWTRWLVDDLAGQLAVDSDLTSREKAELLARAPIIARAHTRAVLVSGWHRLRQEALLDADADGAVH